MNIENIAQKCYPILNPNLRTVKYLNDDPEDVTIWTLVRTGGSDAYICLGDIIALAAAGYIETVPMDTPQTALDYGRTAVAYRILRRSSDR